MIKVDFKRLPHGMDLALPSYATSGSAGMDIRAAEDVVMQPMSVAKIPTGFAIAIPEGYEAQVRSRSGLALKGVVVMNSPGTIDSDFRDEVCVILANHGTEPFEVKRGERIAQMVFAPVTRAELVTVTELDETGRRGGFGSSGVRDSDLERLLEMARNHQMSDAELEQQAQSWVRGEMGMGADADEAAYREKLRKVEV